MDVMLQPTVVEVLVDVFDISRGLVGERKRGSKRWECQ
jgi:hypothetical protein